MFRALPAALAVLTVLGAAHADEALDRARERAKKVGGRIDESPSSGLVEQLDLISPTATDADVAAIVDDLGKAGPGARVHITKVWLRAPVSDAALKKVAELKHTELLDLAIAKLTPAGLGHLTGLRQLKVIRVFSTPVTDEGLKAIAKIGSLQQLYLDGTQVSDSGLEHLAALKGLVILSVRETAVTAAGVKKLEEKLPFATIRH